MEKLLLIKKKKRIIFKTPKLSTNNIPVIENVIEDNLLDKTKIIFINLKERVDRKKYMNNFYQKEKMDIERFNAERITDKFFKNKYPFLELSPKVKKSNNTRWINGTLGCYDSHYTILDRYKFNKDSEFLVILEDDCIIKKDMLNKAIDFINNRPDIDILRINPWKETPTNPYKFTSPTYVSKFSTKNNKFKFDGGTHCCIYHIKNIPKVLNFLKEEYVFHIDAVFSTNKINSWTLKFPEEIKYFSISSIQGEELNKKLNNRLLMKKK